MHRLLVSWLSGLSMALSFSACTSQTTSTASSTSATSTLAPAPSTSLAATTLPIPASSSPVSARLLVDFTEPSSVEGWSIQNDTVMGGRSSSGTTWDDGRLTFSGDVSLENFGGFCSMRSPVSADFGPLAAGATALTLTASGDDKVYVVQVRTDRDLFVQRVIIASGSEDTYLLPFADFTATDFMLDAVTPLEPLDPSSILQIAVYILDKQEGPFRLAIRSFGVV